jgi:hypothetical protein
MLGQEVGLYLWRRNAVLGILGGTVPHVALASTLTTPGCKAGRPASGTKPN